MLCAPDPLKLKVPVPASNSGAEFADTVRLPLMFVVLSLPTKAPLASTKFVGEIALPGLFVHVPPNVTSTSPPRVTFVPWTMTLYAVEMVLP